MAKALYGHMGGPSDSLLLEIRALRRRVEALESEVEQLRSERVGDSLILGELGRGLRTTAAV